MKIGIVGAGAIGGWLGIKLAAAGHDISVLARGKTLEALQARSWKLIEDQRTISAPVLASESPLAIGPQDIVIMAVKAPSLRQIAPRLAPMVAAHTTIIPAMNGVPWWFLLGGGGDLPPSPLLSIDPDGGIEAEIPFSSLLGSVVHVSAATGAPGEVHLKAGNRLILGQPDGGTERLQSAATIFEEAGIDVERSSRIQHDIWYKLWGNMTMNPISAFTGATCDRLRDDPLVSSFVLRVMAEAQEIGRSIGCAIEDRGEDRNEVTRRLGAFKTSMLQDAEAGRSLEIDVLLSAPKEIANKLGIATPNLDTLLGLVRLYGQSHGLYPTETPVLVSA